MDLWTALIVCVPCRLHNCTASPIGTEAYRYYCGLSYLEWKEAWAVHIISPCGLCPHWQYLIGGKLHNSYAANALPLAFPHQHFYHFLVAHSLVLSEVESIENWRKGGWKPFFLKSRLFTTVLEQWLKKYLFTSDENNCSCAVESDADCRLSMCSGPLWKSGSVAISEYVWSRIAHMAAMGRKGEFSAERHFSSYTL